MVNNTEHEYEQIQISVAQAKEKIEMGKALFRLQKDKDFKLLFTDGYLDKYVRRLVSLQALPQMQNEKDAAFISNQIKAIGFMGAYMSYVEQEAAQAKQSLRNDEEEQERMLKEM